MVIKPRRMRWVGHVVHMGEMRSLCLKNLQGRDHLEDLSIDEKIILLEWILGK
jgi:hypothetical protein